jgi:hypothetical protein
LIRDIFSIGLLLDAPEQRATEKLFQVLDCRERLALFIRK